MDVGIDIAVVVAKLGFCIAADLDIPEYTLPLKWSLAVADRGPARHRIASAGIHTWSSRTR